MLLLSLIYGADWSNFLPVFEKGVYPVVEGTINFMAYPNSEVALSLFLVPLMKNKQAYKKALIHSTWITGITLVLLTALYRTPDTAGPVQYSAGDECLG